MVAIALARGVLPCDIFPGARVFNPTATKKGPKAMKGMKAMKAMKATKAMKKQPTKVMKMKPMKVADKNLKGTTAGAFVLFTKHAYAKKMVEAVGKGGAGAAAKEVSKLWKALPEHEREAFCKEAAEKRAQKLLEATENKAKAKAEQEKAKAERAEAKANREKAKAEREAQAKKTDGEQVSRQCGKNLVQSGAPPLYSFQNIWMRRASLCAIGLCERA